jgi:putative aminopeptidase FrvX
MRRTESLSLLEPLLSLPTAPFHERFVSAFLREQLSRTGIDFTVDEYGNIIAGSGSAAEFALVAHMDHPGFEIVSASAASAEAAWHGGVDARYFRGAGVVVYDQDDGTVAGRGTIRNIRKNAAGRVETMTLSMKGRVRAGDFGTWSLVPFRRVRGLIHTKGADDLVGCGAILLTLKRLKAQGVATGVRGVFTRAEEVGFLGTLGMIRSGALPHEAKVISVETSKALPGVVLGGGPVIRLGDRASMFDHRMVYFMDAVARDLAKRDRRFRFQRRVMDGGTCEATPYQLAGHIAGGVAVPLHNYHNQGKTRIGAEAVAIQDVEAAIELLTELARRRGDFDGTAEELRKRIESGWENSGDRLRRG